MNDQIRIGIIGDYRPGHSSHVATDSALVHAADSLRVRMEVEWLQTESLAVSSAEPRLGRYDGLWCGPGDYASTAGALNAIRFARERLRPFIGT